MAIYAYAAAPRVIKNICPKGKVTDMKIDKATVDRLLKQNDEQLWRTVQMIAAQGGVNLAGVKRPADLSKLRSALSSMTDGDIKRATEIVESYKRAGK